MIGLPLVLDSEGLAALTESPPPERLRVYLREALAADRDVLVPTVVCAEVCRGTARTRAVEAVLRRHDGARAARASVLCIDTDFALARAVGAILHAAGADSADLVDAHVVAVCAAHGGGLVVTADPGDIGRLADTVPAVRVMTRSPR